LYVYTEGLFYHQNKIVMPTKIDGRLVDGRFKKGVDRGAMSSNRIPLPVKQKYKPIEMLNDDVPKQIIRQHLAKRQLK
jgi:hypothetical protein